MDRIELAKCLPSPTGVHHWMIPSTGALPVGRCQFCDVERQFKGSYGYEWIDYDEAHHRAIKLAVGDIKAET